MIDSLAAEPCIVRRPRVIARTGLAVLVLLGVVAWAANPTAAGELAAGRKKAAACRACHGMDGLSRQPNAPHIAGQIDFYLREQLVKYRSGQRAHPLMNVVAKTLSDADIDDLVAYYSSIKIIVEVPE
ncbi:MAG: c-type cytochrome [Woeseia sp.]